MYTTEHWFQLQSEFFYFYFLVRMKLNIENCILYWFDKSMFSANKIICCIFQSFLLIVFDLTKLLFRTFTDQPYSTWQTVDPEELRRFQRLAHKWWNEGGDYAALHSMNDIRVPFIR